ncbi:hypothetical protein BDU57DRAFT_533772 [Ampelomyces quisqualis]|uniref:Uncharacterized protein n=1 Tax=Ampelomyces quisqualis TaxID=50730 RepID=A0A6A5Q7R8_AMPQU|nr:hypothetical protein BDU57DRAFT_533772 [Ampelomyces quisqualis]
MSKHSLHASDAGDDAFAPQPKRPNIGSSSPPCSDIGALTDGLDLFGGPDFSSDLPDGLHLDLPDGLHLDLPDSLHLGLPSLSLPLDAQPSPPQSIALSADQSSAISPSALLDDIKRLVADNLTRLILQHHSSDLGRLLPCLPIDESLDRPGSPSKSQPSGARSRTSPPCHDISGGTHVDDDAAVESWPSKPHEWLPPSTTSVAHWSVYRDNFATPSPSTGHAEAQSLSLTPTPLPPYQGLGPGVGPRTSSKSTSICWWDRFRQVPLHRLHVTAAQVGELHQTTLSALHALRNYPAVFGTTASQNSFGHLIRAAWEPSTTASIYANRHLHDSVHRSSPRADSLDRPAQACYSSGRAPRYLGSPEPQAAQFVERWQCDQDA